MQQPLGRGAQMSLSGKLGYVCLWMFFQVPHVHGMHNDIGGRDMEEQEYR